MPQYIEFHFDFTLPCGDLGSEKIDPLADRDAYKVKWRPFFLIGGEPFSGVGRRPTGGGF